MQAPRDPQQSPDSEAAGVRSLARRLLRMHLDKSAARILLVGIAFGIVYVVIALRLVAIGFSGEEKGGLHRSSEVVASNPRPDILDRNGEVLATDLQAVSVFAEPNKLVDKDEAVELITSVLPDLDARALREKFSKRKGFVWVKRDITQSQRDEIYHLGLPGVGFLDEKRRIYPNGVAAAHILGAVNTDNIGIAGIEKYIDAHGLDALRDAGLPMTAESLKPVQLSLDLHAQHALRDELQKGMERYKAKAAGAAIMDVRTGEVIAMVSLPDFDPNKPADALDPNNINRMTVGVFEMGSTYKALTTAMALDAGKITLNSSFDTRSNLRYGKFTIHDYHAM
ncbi:MAG: penicillin-binding protein 2, partial [Hyphomicrobiales bacterium]|nr:penicillin-binding protein 2 [Hyphomicrobiales bacterium]